MLSSEHPNLKPVQLHRILTQYQLTAEIGPVPAWQPSSEDEAYIYRTGTVCLLFLSKRMCKCQADIRCCAYKVNGRLCVFSRSPGKL